jgi:integrase
MIRRGVEQMAKKRGNGEGSIYRRTDGRWVGKYLVHTAKGPKYRYLYGKTRAVVAEKLTKAMADRDSGLIFDAGKVTVGDYLDRWLADSVKGTVRTSTYERHEEIVRLHIKPSLGRVGLKKLTPAHVRGLTARSSIRVSPRLRSARSTPRSTRRSRRPSLTV